MFTHLMEFFQNTQLRQAKIRSPGLYTYTYVGLVIFRVTKQYYIHERCHRSATPDAWMDCKEVVKYRGNQKY